MSDRKTYFNSVLDQLQVAIRNRDTAACRAILENARVHEPEAVDLIVERLIDVGLANATRRA